MNAGSSSSSSPPQTNPVMSIDAFAPEDAAACPEAAQARTPRESTPTITRFAKVNMASLHDVGSSSSENVSLVEISRPDPKIRSP
jgi:hypothetical protein